MGHLVQTFIWSLVCRFTKGMSMRCPFSHPKHPPRTPPLLADTLACSGSDGDEAEPEVLKLRRKVKRQGCPP
jgi:hypothetical protein